MTHGDTLLISQNLRLGHSTNSQIFGCACCQALNSHCPQFLTVFSSKPTHSEGFCESMFVLFLLRFSPVSRDNEKDKSQKRCNRCHLDLLTTSPRNKVPFVDVTPHSQSTRAWVGVRDLVSRCFFSAHQNLYISCKYRKQTKIQPHCTGFTWKALKL